MVYCDGCQYKQSLRLSNNGFGAVCRVEKQKIKVPKLVLLGSKCQKDRKTGLPNFLTLETPPPYSRRGYYMHRAHVSPFYIGCMIKFSFFKGPSIILLWDL